MEGEKEGGRGKIKKTREIKIQTGKYNKRPPHREATCRVKRK
jgi:hypothetical protein